MMNHATRRHIFQRLALAAGSLLLTLLVLEGVIRIAMPQELTILRPDVWQPVPGYGWEKAPRLDTVVNTGEGRVRLLTDAHGYRVGVDGPPPDPTYRVLALGDSFIEALQVPYEQTVTARLEQSLAAALGAPVRVVNTGVSAWGPGQYLRKARDELARQPYDAVVVFLYQGNDIKAVHALSQPPLDRHAIYRLRVHWPPTRATLVLGVLRPLNFRLMSSSHLYVFAKTRLQSLLNQWGLTTVTLPSAIQRSERDSLRWAVTANICADIAAEADAHGVPVLFVLLPSVYQVDDEVFAAYADDFGIDPASVDLDQPGRLLSAELAARGLPHIDMTGPLQAAHHAGSRDLYGAVDTHLGPAGHRVTADVITPYLHPMLEAAP